MDSVSLTSLAAEQLNQARQANSGRASHTLHGGHTHELRQTVVALLAGHERSATTEAVYRHEIRPALIQGAEVMDKIFS